MAASTSIADLGFNHQPAFAAFIVNVCKWDLASIAQRSPVSVATTESGPFQPVGVRQLLGELQPVSRFVP
jgi:hypothetical protein